MTFTNVPLLMVKQGIERYFYAHCGLHLRTVAFGGHRVCRVSIVTACLGFLVRQQDPRPLGGGSPLCLSRRGYYHGGWILINDILSFSEHVARFVVAATVRKEETPCA